MNTNSQNPHTSASNLHPSPERVESSEELIEISQSPQEALLARVSDLEVRLAQVLHEHSALQAEQVQEQPIGLYIQGSNKLSNVMKLFRRIYQLEIYPNQNGVIIKLTYRGFCVLLTVSTEHHYHKWRT